MPDKLKIGALAWWTYKDGIDTPELKTFPKRLLGRLVMMNTQAVSVKILAATAEQVIESGYGVGEMVHTLPSSVEMVTK